MTRSVDDGTFMWPMDCVQCICAGALLNYETCVASINIHIVAKGIRNDWPDDNNIEYSWTGMRKYVGGQWFSRVTRRGRGTFPIIFICSGTLVTLSEMLRFILQGHLNMGDNFCNVFYFIFRVFK